MTEGRFVPEVFFFDRTNAVIGKLWHYWLFLRL